MSPPRFVPAHELDLEPLAALFNRGYEGYFVPVQLDPATFAGCLRAWDIDLAAARVAIDDGRPVAFALLGLRDRRGWVGGMGVVPECRGRGLGRAAMEAVVAEARARRLAQVELEVLEQNVWAARIYEGMGFADRRLLEVWTRPAAGAADPAPAAPTVEPLAVDEALATLAALGPPRAPWQRDLPSLAHQRERLGALAVRGTTGTRAVIVFQVTPRGVAVHALAATPDAPPEARAALLAGLRARHPGATTFANLPAGDPAGADLAAAGFAVPLRQREMVLAL